MEIYRNTPQDVDIRVPFSYYANYTVTVKSAGGEDVHGNLNPTDYGNHARIAVPIGFKHTQYDGEIDINIEMIHNAEPFTLSEKVSVVTPLFTSDDLGDEYPADDVPELERLVRHVIEAHTGQKFGRQRKAFVSSGNVAHFDAPLIMLDSVEPGVHMNLSTTLNPPKMPYEVFADRLGVRINWELYDPKTDSMWVLNRRQGGVFTVRGEFGYNHVPQPVKEAALLIAGMWTDDQSVWRDRYIRTIRSSDWSVQYSGMSYRSTGSVTADMLLESYVRKNQPGLI